MRVDIRDEMIEFVRELHAYIYSFEGWVRARFREVQDPNLSGIQEEIDILHMEVRSLAENQVPVIPLIILLFSQPLPLYPSIRYNLIAKDDRS